LHFVKKDYIIDEKIGNFYMQNNKVVTFLSLLFFVLIISIAANIYNHDKNSILETIDQELLAGANAVPFILEENYHHKELNSISKEQDLKHIKELSDYVKHTKLAYIYSFVKDKDGNIRFSSSSATDEELKNHDQNIYSFDIYNDKTVAKVFETKKIIFQNNSDVWGNFRSVYVPQIASDGSLYVTGADYKISDIESLQVYQRYKVLLIFIPLLIVTVIYFVIIFLRFKNAQNIIEEKTKELQKIYEVDKLTHLPNREKLLKYIRSHPNLMLAIIDVNNFKAINEIYGIKLADKFLINLAYEINHLINYDMNLYKLNNDLFCITSTNLNQHYFLQYIQSLLEKLEKTEFIDDTYTIRAIYTAGISHTEKIGNPLLAAEYAVDKAKKIGQKVIAYDGSYEEISETTNKRKILDDINYAIKNKKIFPYFQPIYNVHTKTITKYEALVRMELKNGEIVNPYYFLKIAIDTGLYKHITKNMLESVINTAKLHPHLEFSINMSSLDIENEDIKNYILETIINNKLENQITLEILESEDFQSFQTLINFSHDAQENNIKLSIDDFGSGYSNFSNLIEIHFNYLKIDGSLVRNILVDERYEVIIEQIVSFARQLDSQVIAEFVENEAIALKLEELGVDMLQGYYIGKPSANLIDGLSI
jgi:c-di-GMP phosphodiesterase